METPRVRSKRRPAEERRTQILEAALDCFASKGFHAATMDDLVRASGLSKGSLYWHFESKQDVFLALFDAFAEASFAEWDALIAAGCPTLEAAERATLGKLDAIGGERGLSAWVEFFAHPQARGRFAQVYREVRARLERSLLREMEAGTLRRLAPDELAASITACGEGLLLQAMVDPEFDLHRHWAATRALIQRGIAP
jgi:AcrR family transcriptional regulator